MPENLSGNLRESACQDSPSFFLAGQNISIITGRQGTDGRALAIAHRTVGGKVTIARRSARYDKPRASRRPTDEGIETLAKARRRREQAHNEFIAHQTKCRHVSTS